ncbi:MAG: 4Fe-4S dicluster domain-containing protein, partial [Thermoplasmata archaeon]|nr:4Fe-4S dicluster domain-containing protein [Thermoplasmata archaeon]
MTGSKGKRVKIGVEEVRRCLSSECSFCRENCPAYLAFHLDSYSSRGKNRVILGYNREGFESEELVEVAYACTMCGQCSEVCLTDGAFFGYAKELRSELVREGLAPDVIKAMVKNIRDNNTPFDSKDQGWAEKGKKGKIAYFPGCTIQACNPEL